MQDSFHREITYLRLSITQDCNYRCRYCIPDGTNICRDQLSADEYLRIVRAAAACGVRKVRLTGGEPLLHPDLVWLCRQIRQISGIKELTVTTNGSLLSTLAMPLKQAGADRLNISLDTLNEKKFSSMTGTGKLKDVLAGIEAARRAGFGNIKLNTVLIGGFNDADIPSFLDYVKNTELSLRFIELMPMHSCASWPVGRFISADDIIKSLPALKPMGIDGVAELYRIPGHTGTIGFIRPMSHKFCASCSRIRVTADGNLKPCLHSRGEIPLRGLREQELIAAIRRGILCKPKSHHMDSLTPTDTPRAMHEIGG